MVEQLSEEKDNWLWRIRLENGCFICMCALAIARLCRLDYSVFTFCYIKFYTVFAYERISSAFITF